MIYVKFPIGEGPPSNDARKRREWLANQLLLPWQTEISEMAEKPSGLKCWYSERPLDDLHEAEVDHYRPKGRTSPIGKDQLRRLKKDLGDIGFLDNSAFSGYPWLEHDIRNLRLASHGLNKQKQWFPIVNGTPRLLQTDHLANCLERPIFLDPTDRRDASLLSVFPSGDLEILPPPPSASRRLGDSLGLSEEELNYCRAFVSIRLLQLDHQKLVRDRKNRYGLVVRKVEELKSAFQEFVQSKTHLNREKVQKIDSELFGYLLGYSKFALAARTAVNDRIKILTDEGENALAGWLKSRLEEVIQRES